MDWICNQVRRRSRVIFAGGLDLFWTDTLKAGHSNNNNNKNRSLKIPVQLPNRTLRPWPWPKMTENLHRHLCKGYYFFIYKIVNSCTVGSFFFFLPSPLDWATGQSKWALTRETLSTELLLLLCHRSKQWANVHGCSHHHLSPLHWSPARVPLTGEASGQRFQWLVGTKWTTLFWMCSFFFFLCTECTEYKFASLTFSCTKKVKVESL